jgi:UDPglucose--hexose-1-phosphate uridylyltransferase
VNRGDENIEPAELLDPTTGRPVLMAPQRRHRPFLTGVGASVCPFCSGHEASTPEEVDAARDGVSPADAPGWTVRVFPNKYPASRHHEVIAEGADHLEQPADLDIATWRAVLPVWQRRLRAIEAQPGVGSAFLFKNVGRLAGASIGHNHTQVLGLSDVPPRVQLELAAAARLGICPWCESIASAPATGRLVFATARHVVLVPAPSKLPHETWLLPKACDDDFLATDVDSLAAALHGLFTAVHASLDAPPFNMWLHRLPGRAPGQHMHWHFELQPRTGQLAGLELGAEVYINSVPAPVAAARLRSGLPGGAAAGQGPTP